MRQFFFWLCLLALLAVAYVSIAGWPFPPTSPAAGPGVNVDVEKGKTRVDVNVPGVQIKVDSK